MRETNQVNKKILFTACILAMPINIIATPTGFDWQEDDSSYVQAETYDHYEINSKRAQKEKILDRKHDVCDCQEKKPVIKDRETKEPTEEIKPTEITFTCPICLEEETIKETEKKDASCCECGCIMHRKCKQQLIKHYSAFEEKSGSHPHALQYGDAHTSDENAIKIERYQNATPESEPTWQWYTIDGRNYFLEDGLLWHYAQDEVSDNEWNYADPWKYRKPPFCPVCMKPDMVFLEKFRYDSSI